MLNSEPPMPDYPTHTSKSAGTDYGSVFDDLLEGCQIIGVDWRFLYVNEAAARYARQSKAEMLARPVMECYKGIENSSLFPVMQRCMTNRTAQDADFAYTFPDGSTAWFACRIRPITEGIVVYMLDRTEHMRSESKLQQSESQYQLLAENMADVIWILETNPMGFSYVSPSVEQLRGYTPDEVMKQPMEEVITPASLAMINSELPGRIHRFLAGDNEAATATHEVEQFRKDGSTIWTEVVTKLLLDSHGALQVLGVSRDISSRKREEAARRVGEERYRFLFQHMLNGLAYCKMVFEDGHPHDFVYLEVNDAFENLTGLKDVVGKNVSEIIPDIRSSDRELLEAYGRVALTGQPERFEIYVKGLAMWFSVAVYSPQRDYFVAIFDVITARKQAEALLREAHDTLEQQVAMRTAELQAAKERVEGILNNSADGILLTYSDFTIEQTNPTFNRMFRCEPTTYFKQPLTALLCPICDEELTRTIYSGVSSAHEITLEVRACRQDRTEFDAEFRIGFIEKGGYVCMVSDITERKAHVRQLQYQASLQKNMSDAVVVTDMDYRIQSWNDAAERIYGWTAEEAIGKTTTDVLRYEGMTSEQLSRTRQLFREQGWWQGEVIQHHKDGQIRNVLGSVTLIKDEHGDPFGIVAVNHDITERKQVEAALLKSAAEIHDLYERAPCGYHSLDKDGVIIQINDTEIDWLGYSRDEVVGKLNMCDIFTPDSVVRFRNNFPLFKQRGWINDLEFDVIRKNGSIMHILLNATAVYDEQGQFVSTRSSMFDISELKVAQQALVDSEARYRLLAENVTDVITKVNPEGIRTFATPAVYPLLGYSPQELIGQHALQIVHPDDYLDAQANMTKAMTSEADAYSITHRVRHIAGHYLWVEVRASIVRDPTTGRAIEMVSVMRDISERKQAEETLLRSIEREKELSELKSRFVSMTSHEFRTPLATILAVSESLNHYRLKMTDEQIQQRLVKIGDQVQYLTSITEDVLQLGKLQTRRIEFTPVPTNLDLLCQSILDEFRGRPDITHQFLYSCSDPIQLVTLDNKLMRQILNNLVSNAIKYSPSDKPVSVSLDYVDEQLILKVGDQGMGIPDADLMHLFEPFHRAANVRTIRGTGLGLTITKESVEMHHGTITVESQLGVGTTFTVRIPLA